MSRWRRRGVRRADLKIVASDADKAGQESEQVNQQQALIQAFPNLKGIIIPAGIGLPAAARALEKAGSLGKIKLTGLAPATLIKKYIQNGSVQDIWWNVKDLGYLAYYGAEALAEGKITR